MTSTTPNYKSLKVTIDIGPIVGSLKAFFSDEEIINIIATHTDLIANKVIEHIKEIPDELTKKFLLECVNLSLDSIKKDSQDKSNYTEILAVINKLESGIQWGLADAKINSEIITASNIFDLNVVKFKNFINKEITQEKSKKRKECPIF